MQKLTSIFQGDRVIWIIYFFLCLISLIEVFSAGSTLAYKSGTFWAPLLKQAAFLAGGTVVALAIHAVPCRHFRPLPLLLYPVSLLLLVITLFGGKTNDAARWIDLGIVQFQPSEIAKGTLIITVALVLSVQQTEKGTDPKAFKVILILAGLVCGLILPENFSTAALLFGVVVLMMFIGRVPYKQLGKLFGSLALVVGLVVAVVAVTPDDSPLYKLPGMGRMLTWKNRIVRHGADERPAPKDYDIDKDGQIAHANIAIVSSNGIGKMPGNSVERDFLSQAYSDFIFAIIIEEMGLWGAFIVMALYLILLFRASIIAGRCERNFPAFLVMGLALLLVSQAFLNMLVAVGLFPVTGQPLPLISRGGTSTLITCAYFGMMLSVSRYSRQSEQPVDPAQVNTAISA